MNMNRDKLIELMKADYDGNYSKFARESWR